MCPWISDQIQVIPLMLLKGGLVLARIICDSLFSQGAAWVVLQFPKPWLSDRNAIAV